MPLGREAADIISGVLDRVVLADFKATADMAGKFLEMTER
jgi:hypothetical protein